MVNQEGVMILIRRSFLTLFNLLICPACALPLSYTATVLHFSVLSREVSVKRLQCAVRNHESVEQIPRRCV